MDTQKIKMFSSLEEENRFERQRLAQMTPEERCREFAILQERVWGSDWTSKPMTKIASYETLSW